MRKLSRTAATLTAALALGTGGMLAAPAATAAPAAPAAECGVRPHDGRLWCGNGAPVILRYGTLLDSPVSGQLQTSSSYFLCWSTGQQHGGGNSTWYYTDADWGDPGYVPAQYVYTPSWFDANPSAYGLRHC